MFTRIITALICIPFLLYIIIKGGLVLELSIIIIAMIGSREIYRAFENQYKPLKIPGYISVLSILISIIYRPDLLGPITGLTVIGILVIMVLKYPKYSIIDVSVTVFSTFYIAFLFPFIYLIRDMSVGGFLVWLIFISAWGTDTFAYFTGTFIGKNKLVPKLSPNKTIEGAVGGVLGAALLSFVYTWAYGTYYNAQILDYILVIPLITLFASVIAQIGDLAASAIKRFLEVKDFGYILPGHGGIIDRFDSVLFTAPFVYFILYLLI